MNILLNYSNRVFFLLQHKIIPQVEHLLRDLNSILSWQRTSHLSLSLTCITQQQSEILRQIIWLTEQFYLK